MNLPSPQLQTSRPAKIQQGIVCIVAKRNGRFEKVSLETSLGQEWNHGLDVRLPSQRRRNDSPFPISYESLLSQSTRFFDFHEDPLHRQRLRGGALITTSRWLCYQSPTFSAVAPSSPEQTLPAHRNRICIHIWDSRSLGVERIDRGACKGVKRFDRRSLRAASIFQISLMP